MKLSLKITESNKEISNRIIKTLIPQVHKYMIKNEKEIKSGLPVIIAKAIESSPEYSSILGGQLKYELGIPNSPAVLSSLIDIWINSLYVKYDPPRFVAGQIKSSLNISMIKADFSDVLGSSYAYVYDLKRKYTLPWLSWLLLEGQAPIIQGHKVVMGPNPASRTGMAIMSEDSSSWSVPSKFAGTVSDNWITRSIYSYSGEISNFLKRTIEK